MNITYCKNTDTTIVFETSASGIDAQPAMWLAISDPQTKNQLAVIISEKTKDGKHKFVIPKSVSLSTNHKGYVYAVFEDMNVIVNVSSVEFEEQKEIKVEFTVGTNKDAITENQSAGNAFAGGEQINTALNKQVPAPELTIPQPTDAAKNQQENQDTMEEISAGNTPGTGDEVVPKPTPKKKFFKRAADGKAIVPGVTDTAEREKVRQKKELNSQKVRNILKQQ